MAGRWRPSQKEGSVIQTNQRPPGASITERRGNTSSSTLGWGTVYGSVWGKKTDQEMSTVYAYNRVKTGWPRTVTFLLHVVRFKHLFSHQSYSKIFTFHLPNQEAGDLTCSYMMVWLLPMKLPFDQVQWFNDTSLKQNPLCCFNTLRSEILNKPAWSLVKSVQKQLFLVRLQKIKSQLTESLVRWSVRRSSSPLLSKPQEGSEFFTWAFVQMKFSRWPPLTYHHFSKRILSLERPRSVRVFETASIMGGGPHK